MPQLSEPKADKPDDKLKLDSKLLKAVLKTSGMNATVVDKEKWDTDVTAKRTLCKLVKVTDEEYTRAGGTL